MKRAENEGGRGNDAALATMERESADRVGMSPEWEVCRWNRVGLRCLCGHTIEESGPTQGRELLAREDLATDFLVAEDGGSILVAECPECGGTMEAFTPDAEAGRAPDSVERVQGNLLLNEGIDILIALICAIGSETAYDNTNAQLGVGNDNTAAAAAQTDLQGGSTAWKAMDVTYPQDDGSQGAVWKSTFGSSEGNFAWEEVSVRNGATADENLNRKVSSLGTKGSGTTWTLQLTITFS